MMKHYEVVVIGAGPGGYPCAIRLGQLKKKVLVVEAKLLGGLCLNWGCIPTKALSYAAEMVDGLSKAKRMGFDVTFNGYDIEKLRGWKETVVKRLRTGIEFLFKANNVDWMQGMARIQSEHEVEVKHNGTVETFEADNIVIATGTDVISLPGLNFDHKRIIDTDDALELTEIPKRLLVVGAGASGLEMATVYSRLGSEVVVVEIMEQILPGMDRELCENLYKIIRKSGIDIYLKSQVKGYAANGDKLQVSVDKEGSMVEESYDKILVTVGRRPSNKAFGGLEVDVDKRGYLVTDECLRTSIKNIYAIGDITGPPLLAHKATKQGVMVAEIISGERKQYEQAAIPSCVFTIPPLSAVGLTEQEAIAQGYKVSIGRFPFRALGKAVSMAETEGVIKIVGDESGKLLGVHILGAEASNLIGEAVLAIDKGLAVSDLAESIHPHPTLTEALQEAAEAFLKKAIHIANK